MIFKGSCVALVTPFDEGGAVNYYSLKNLLDFHLASGTNAICILGTTGEGSAVTPAEREKIVKFSACLLSKKVPLIVGVCSNDTAQAIVEAKSAEQHGADALLVVTPHYNRCNQAGLYLHFKRIAESVKIPIILYNVPKRTGVNLEIFTIHKLSKIKNIVGLKEASGDLVKISELVQLLPKSFAIYSGDDLLALPSMCLGASGVISVTANAYPELVANMCEFALSKDLFNALRLHNYLFKLSQALTLDINPIPIKHYLNFLGWNVGEFRLPLSSAGAEVKRKLSEVKKFYEN